MSGDLQGEICVFEMIAQVILFVLRASHSVSTVGPRWFHQFSDSTLTVGAINKLASTKEASSFGLQVLARHLQFNNAQLTVSHIPGVQNCLADMLSRWESNPSLHSLLSPHKRVHVDLARILDVS